MKKILFLALAVLMILPLVVACSSAPEGNPIAVADFSVISYSTAYDEAGTKDEAMAVEIYKGEVTAYVAEGATMTLKDVIEGYIYDKGVDASTNSAGTIYESLAGYAADGTFFWNFYVNGREASLSAQVQPTDSIKVVFEKYVLKKEKTGFNPVFFLCRKMEKLRKMKLKGPIFLTLAAFFWGTTFVAQDLSCDFVKPFTFNALRMILGSLFLVPVVFVKNKGRFFGSLQQKGDKKRLFLASALCSLVLLVAANLQQFGIFMGTGAGKSGFITAMYVVLVPIVGIFLRKKIRPVLWLCVLVSVVGLYLLCMASFSQGFSGILQNLRMSKGDLLTLGCALFYTFHIIIIDYAAPNTDGVLLSLFQFFFAGVLGLVLAFVFEKPELTHIVQGSGGILYSAFFSCAVAYTLQILGQQCTPAVVASILMCMESVFAVLSDMVVLKTVLTPEEIIGCVLMFVAILGSSLSDFIPQKKKE